MQLPPVLLRKVHVRKYVVLGLLDNRCCCGIFGPEQLHRFVQRLMRQLRRRLREDRLDRRGNVALRGLRHPCQHIPLEVHRTALPHNPIECPANSGSYLRRRNASTDSMIIVSARTSVCSIASGCPYAMRLLAVSIASILLFVIGSLLLGSVQHLSRRRTR